MELLYRILYENQVSAGGDITAIHSEKPDIRRKGTPRSRASLPVSSVSFFTPLYENSHRAESNTDSATELRDVTWECSFLRINDVFAGVR